MILKVLEDNRLLKEDSDKMKNTLKANTKLISQLQEQMRILNHHNSSSNNQHNGESHNNNKRQDHTINNINRIKHISIDQTNQEYKQSTLNSNNNKLKDEDIESPRSNKNRVRIKEESMKKRKKDSISKQIDNEKSSMSRSHDKLFNIKGSKKDEKIEKKSVFKIIAEEQQNRHNLFVMNDNSLPSLIFSDFDQLNDGSAQYEIKMLEKLVLKNTHIALLNNLLSDRSQFSKVILQMNESHINNLYDTLRRLYIEIIELLRGGRRIRNIFDSAPQIISSMSVDVCMVLTYNRKQ